MLWRLGAARATNYSFTWILIMVCAMLMVAIGMLGICNNIKIIYRCWEQAKGVFFEELPINHIILRLSSQKNFFKSRKRHSVDKITIAFKTKVVRTKNEIAAKKSREENNKRKTAFCREVVLVLCSHEICLLDKTCKLNKKGTHLPYQYGFRLDSGYSWREKSNSEWLKKEDKIVNAFGEVIAVRGISKETAALGYDIYVPKAIERELKNTKASDLLCFSEPENCKFQISKSNSEITTLKTAGYSKKDVVLAIQKAARMQEYKVKIIKSWSKLK